MWEHVFEERESHAPVKNQPMIKKTTYKINTVPHKVQERKCPFHEVSHHTVHECQLFKGSSLENKEKLVREKKLCFNYLGHHKRVDCTSKTFCKVNGFQQHHHPLLHEVLTKQASTTETKSEYHLN